MTEKRREGPGDLKSTVRRWPLPSSLAPDKVEGKKNLREGMSHS